MTVPPADTFSSPPPAAVRGLVAILRFAVPIVIIALAILGANWLLAARPEAARREIEVRPTLVETLIPVSGSQVAEITGYGTVEAHRVLTLQSQVGGQVIELNDDLREGGRVTADEPLLRIEPRDYEIAVVQREADVANAAVALQLEEARGLVAEREWEMLGESITVDESGRRLARREPQRIEKEAMLAAARGRLAQAELDLERTTIKAPFNGLVLQDDVEIGQVVGPQNRVATIVGTDRFDVVVSLPMDRLPWLRADPEDLASNSTAIVVQELGDGRNVVREGRVDHIIGEVERSGRLARVRIAVMDPLGLAASDPATAIDPAAGTDLPLLLGSYVRVEIAGPTLDDVVELPRAVLRDNETVWVKDATNHLRIQPVEILVGRPRTVLVRSFLGPDEEVVASPLPVAIPGMPLERLDAAGTPGVGPETGSTGDDADGGEA